MTENQSLKNLNTFGIEAQAAKFVELNQVEEARDFFKSGAHKQSDFLILGGGSNILLTGNYNGLVIKNDIKGIEVAEESEENITIKVGAGENWHQLVMHCVDNKYAGIENLSLIPGKVGASPMQNIGAYGVEVKDVITEVEAIEISSGKVKIFNNEDCKFEYRSSVFKTTLKNQYFITAVTFKLSKTPTFSINYGAIKSQLEINGVKEDELSIKAISDAVIAIRQSKLPDPAKIGNAGSFFKNPVIGVEKFHQLKKRLKSMPAYELPDGGFKLAAGWLIEKAGWKGFREDNYGVHKNQALVLVNYGGAQGADILALSDKIIKSIRKKFGIELEREVNIV